MPTVSLDTIFCTLIVDAHEIRNMTNFDIPGAYLHADTPKEKRIIMNLKEDVFDIMCQVNPEYDQNVRYEYGK